MIMKSLLILMSLEELPLAGVEEEHADEEVDAEEHEPVGGPLGDRDAGACALLVGTDTPSRMSIQAASPSSPRRAARGLEWNSPSAALGAVYGLPGAALALAHVRPGLALAVGVLPASIAGLAPT